MDIKDCSSCGGQVEFSPQNKGLRCLKCGKIYPIKYKKTIDKHDLDYKDNKKWVNENLTLQCKNCGAKIMLNKYDISTRCQYCESPTLVEISSDLLKPEVVIPFKITKEEASVKFKDKVVKKNFLPLDFKKRLPKATIGATYISSFNFDFLADATYTADEEYAETIIDKDGNKIQQTRTRSVNGSVQHKFVNMVIESSNSISQLDIDYILPYHFNEGVDFDDDFIRGYTVEYYDQPAKDCFVKAENKAEAVLKHMVENKYSGKLINLRIWPKYNNVKYNYTLLPAYFINFKYENKTYLNLMNGQTGKLGGKVPRSALQITMFTLFMVLIVIGFPLLIFILSNL